MTWLISIISGAALRIIGGALTRALIWKAFITSMVVFVLPVVLFKLFNRILTDTMTYAFSQMDDSNIDSVTIALSGLGAWCASQVNLSGCFSVFLSALALKWTLGVISPRLG